VPGYQSLNRIPDPNRFNPPDRLSFALTIELEIVLIMNYEPTRENESIVFFVNLWVPQHCPIR
jgi:hypothetical protein